MAIALFMPKRLKSEQSLHLICSNGYLIAVKKLVNELSNKWRGMRALRNENILLRFRNTALQRPEAMCRWNMMKCDFKDINGVLSCSLIEQSFLAIYNWRSELAHIAYSQTPPTFVGFIITFSHFLSLNHAGEVISRTSFLLFYYKCK